MSREYAPIDHIGKAAKFGITNYLSAKELGLFALSCKTVKQELEYSKKFRQKFSNEFSSIHQWIRKKYCQKTFDNINFSRLLFLFSKLLRVKINKSFLPDDFNWHKEKDNNAEENQGITLEKDRENQIFEALFRAYYQSIAKYYSEKEIPESTNTNTPSIGFLHFSGHARTLLHWATLLGQKEETIKLVITYPDDTIKVDTQKESPLFIAAKAKNRALYDILQRNYCLISGTGYVSIEKNIVNGQLTDLEKSIINRAFNTVDIKRYMQLAIESNQLASLDCIFEQVFVDSISQLPNKNKNKLSTEVIKLTDRESIKNFLINRTAWLSDVLSNLKNQRIKTDQLKLLYSILKQCEKLFNLKEKTKFNQQLNLLNQKLFESATQLGSELLTYGNKVIKESLLSVHHNPKIISRITAHLSAMNRCLSDLKSIEKANQLKKEATRAVQFKTVLLKICGVNLLLTGTGLTAAVLAAASILLPTMPLGITTTLVVFGMIALLLYATATFFIGKYLFIDSKIKKTSEEKAIDRFAATLITKIEEEQKEENQQVEGQNENVGNTEESDSSSPRLG